MYRDPLAGPIAIAR